MKATVNGIGIHYEITGEGPWLTLSHSLACNLHMWDEQVALLSRHFRVLNVDTRGHGDSDAPDGPYTLEQLADDYQGLFDHLGIRDTHWVGLSMGGMIGQVLALRHPGLFRSLALCDTTSQYAPEAAALWAERVRVSLAQGMEPLVEGTLGRWFTEPFRNAQPATVARVAAMIRATKPAGYAGCCAALPKIDTTARLGEITCPIQVIVGEQDAGTPVAMARTIHENAPGSELVIIPNASHLSNVEQPQAFNEALTGFYRRIGAMR
jgi:3-oxoadipate enol-lactonase